MPTYEYLCRECGERLEVFQRFTDKPLRTHAGCGGSLQKVFHPSGVVFKGSGFYVTDSRPNGKSPAGKESSDDKKADQKADKRAGKEAGKKPEKKESVAAVAD